MDSIAHYATAESFLQRAHSAGYDTEQERYYLGAAQVHATLALAAVTALSAHDEGGMPFEDCLAWTSAASVTAPIPPEAEDEPEDDVPRVGEIGPTGDMRPDALGAWLRALPHRTILRDIDGDPYQVSTGYETVHGQPDREFPALVELGGMPREITDGHPQLTRLAKFHAPFTVLYLGPEA